MRIDDFNLQACHLIKLDVEGMELPVLKGAVATIERRQPLLYVEVDRADRRDDVLIWLDEHGYAIYGHHVPLYNPQNFKANPTNVFDDIVSVNVLADPRERPAEHRWLASGYRSKATGLGVPGGRRVTLCGYGN